MLLLPIVSNKREHTAKDIATIIDVQCQFQHSHRRTVFQ